MADTTQPPDHAFQCLRCGNCCRHAGEVRLTGDDAAAIAAILNIDIHTVTAHYTRMREDRRGLSLLERPDGACIFFIDDPPACRIHAAKPHQCRTFPVEWRYADIDTVCPAAHG